jgi:hypothetical protein
VKHAPRVIRASGARPDPITVASLDRLGAVVWPGALDIARVRAWSRAVRRARGDWTADFGGEQYSLGRAFYTHYETGRAGVYFRDAALSNALVERHLPGMQAWVVALFARMTGVIVRQRLGFCAPGVHVFPAGGHVARHGGIVHYDVEGLSPLCLSRRHPALSLVVMLEPVEWGGGLWLWGVRYHGTEAVTEAEIAAPHAVVRYGPGDALLMSSYRLHQIRPFRGRRDRISITLHAQQVDSGVFEVWF